MTTSKPATTKCPNCSKEVLVGALSCRHCGSDLRQVFVLPERNEATSRSDTRLDRILGLWNQGLGGKIIFLTLIFFCCIAPACGMMQSIGRNLASSTIEEAPTTNDPASFTPLSSTATWTVAPTSTPAP